MPLHGANTSEIKTIATICFHAIFSLLSIKCNHTATKSIPTALIKQSYENDPADRKTEGKSATIANIVGYGEIQIAIQQTAM